MRIQTANQLNQVLAQDALQSKDLADLERITREIREICRAADLDFQIDPHHACVESHLTAVKHGWTTGDVKLFKAVDRPATFPITNLADQDFNQAGVRKHFADLVNTHLRETLKLKPNEASFRQIEKPGCVVIGYYFATFSITVVSHGMGHGVVTITSKHRDTVLALETFSNRIEFKRAIEDLQQLQN